MRRLLLPAALVALAALPAAPASAHYAGVGKQCKPVVFEPNTDSGASDIHAKNVRCRRARRMARQYSNGVQTPFDYSCQSRSHDPANGIAHEDVLCRKGTKRVSWAAT